MVKFSNSDDLATLSQKLEHLFKNNLIPMAGKNKAKSVEEEVSNLSNKLIRSLALLEKLQDCIVSL